MTKEKNKKISVKKIKKKIGAKQNIQREIHGSSFKYEKTLMIHKSSGKDSEGNLLEYNGLKFSTNNNDI